VFEEPSTGLDEVPTIPIAPNNNITSTTWIDILYSSTNCHQKTKMNVKYLSLVEINNIQI
jgi:hypothetical protein